MVELLRTNDIVLISVIETLLREAGVYFFVADENMSVLEGSLGFLPRRVWVAGDEADKARRLLREAGFGAELSQG
jgi:Putative prokaryotic signal transducing protein